jgi:hypothetical protein
MRDSDRAEAAADPNHGLRDPHSGLGPTHQLFHSSGRLLFVLQEAEKIFLGSLVAGKVYRFINCVVLLIKRLEHLVRQLLGITICFCLIDEMLLLSE